ncbi:hypothetical protein X975_01960, partial [Stegodyphus mimosarum]
MALMTKYTLSVVHTQLQASVLVLTFPYFGANASIVASTEIA